MYDRTTRRNFVVSGTAIGTGILAGCLGSESDDNDDTDDGGNNDDSGNNDDTGNADDTGEPIDPTLSTDIHRVPTEMTLNPYLAGGEVIYMAHDYLGGLNPYQGEGGIIHPELAADWSLDGTTATVQLRDDYVWWDDNTSVTAQDLVTKMHLDKYFQENMWENVADVYEADTYTVEYELETEVNESIVWTQLVGDVQLDVKHDLFVDRLEAIEDASTDEEKEEAQAEVLDWDLTEPLFGNSLAKITNVTNSAIIAEINEQHPHADKINFDEFEWISIEEEQSRDQAILNNRVDFNDGMAHPPGFVDRLDDHWKVTYHPQFRGHGLIFNQEAEHVGKREVRQAIAYLMDTEQITQNQGFSLNVISPIDNRQTGMSGGVVDMWLGDQAEQYPNYDVDAGKAESLLNQAGYEKEDGTWIGEEGEELEITLTAPVPDQWAVNAMQTIRDRLVEIDITAEVEPTGSISEYFPLLENGNYQVGWYNWGAAGRTHPTFSFEQILGNGGPSRDWLRVPEEIEVPMPIGDPDGELESINVAEENAKLRQNIDPEEERELVRTLAWAHNQYLAIIGWNEVNSPRYIRDDNWNIPSEDDPIWTIKEVKRMIAQGLITAKTK